MSAPNQSRLSTPEASKALGIPVHVITYWLGQIPYPAEQDEAGQWKLTPEAMAVLQTVKELKESNRSMESIRRQVKHLQDTPPAPVRPATVKTAAPPTNSAAVKSNAPRPAGATAPRPRPAGSPPAAPSVQDSPRAAKAADAEPPRPPVRPKAPVEASPIRMAPVPHGAAAMAEGGRSPTSFAQPNAANVQAADAAAFAAHIARAVSEVVRQENALAQRYAHAAHQIGKLEAENEHLKVMLTSATSKHAREQEEARNRIAELEARLLTPPPKKRGFFGLF